MHSSTALFNPLYLLITISQALCFNNEIRSQFPILNRPVTDKQRLVYLDNAAGAQVPAQTINVIKDYYELYNSNVFKSQHFIAQQTTQLYKQALDDIAMFIGAKADNLIITSGATQAIQIAASSISHNFNEGDEIILSNLEHSSNVIPWKILALKQKLNIKYAKIDKNGHVDVDKLLKLITGRTKLISLVYASSVLGTLLDTERIASICQQKKILFMLDGCQASPHLLIDVGILGCDLFVSSGHKIYGPTGVGFLYASTNIFGKLIYPFNQYQTSGVSPFSLVDFQGTPPIAQVLGLASSLNFLKQNLPQIIPYEAELREYLVEQLLMVPGLDVYMHDGKVPIVSFNIKNTSPIDISIYLDTLGIAIRAGQHCSPLSHNYLNVPATCRVSLAMYNDKSDIDRLVSGLKQFVSITAV
ncbi:cystein desulfurase [Babesia microti strain RI]|uniref:cysteine desulfurase n=1 Tax=Babesia microti (strain RI) TaxID=1133968 RepID=A0A1R4ABE2_BABMR|nr:cystein desulfurase [Babesia microti strain RI]SJK86341.1 cystein desulfurase [Babesia microti strain RI]|eukprot:XP_021338511.1 cystein desulfurase [Babesia microti strain RI]